MNNNKEEQTKQLVENILITAQKVSEVSKQRFVEELIDNLIEQRERLSIMTSYGEPCILLSDIVNFINNIADTDYKRYSAYNARLRYTENNPSKVNELCSFCKNYWRNHENEGYQGCLGIKLKEGEKFNSHKKPCEKYISKEDNISIELE